MSYTYIRNNLIAATDSLYNFWDEDEHVYYDILEDIQEKIVPLQSNMGLGQTT